MKAFPLAVLAMSLCVPAQAALSPKAEAFLTSIGLIPTSPEVSLAINDGVISTTFNGDSEQYSLEQLATEGKRNGTKAFVGTRNFIAKLTANFAGTSIPATNYDPLYLTVQERALAGRKFAERFKKS
ncbi:MAG: hypothetical protein COV48_04270 [Elusimicrobia bacterium CG11_big_fil_rev_8_21_14_0_20_64_6]|nr:MAG: hypothetical protein COV48_04270 [Elusimicrobia bacterium CG11_big_fil_rev_8_21_14_0_20_64_6]